MARNGFEDIAASKQATPAEEGTRATQRARQGITGQGVRYVLAASLAGIVIGFGFVLFFAR